VSKFSSFKGDTNNPAEQDIITRELLDQVTTFPHLREEQAECSKPLPPWGRKKPLRHTKSLQQGGDKTNHKHIRGRRAILDLAGHRENMV